MLRRYLLFILAFTLAPTGDAAQDAACLRRTLPLSVQDSRGLPIRGLTPSDLAAKIRDADIKIVSITPDERPHRIVILLDASGSMKMSWLDTLVLASALAELQVPNVQMALLIFGTKIQEKVDFTAGQRAVAERLRQIRSGAKNATKSIEGRTALYDALLAGVQLLGSSASSADVLYFISDGADNASQTRVGELSRELTSRGVRLFAADVFTPIAYRNRTPEEINGPRQLDDLIKQTGGDMILPFPNGPPAKPDWHTVGQVMNVFYLRMVQNYLVELELSSSLNKRRKWELNLVGARREQWKGARLKYPDELLPCGDLRNGNEAF
jgi:VWA domain containing CoxE-like protein